MALVWHCWDFVQFRHLILPGRHAQRKFFIRIKGLIV